MATWQRIMAQDFTTAGTWEAVNPASGAVEGPVEVIPDGTDSAAIARGAKILRAGQGSQIQLAASSLYRVQARLRTLTTPTGVVPRASVGFSGVASDGTTTINQTGAPSPTGQAYACCRDQSITTAYTTYIGYVMGTATPGGEGPANDIGAPLKMHPAIAYVRPHAYMLPGATDGEMLLTAVTVDEVPSAARRARLQTATGAFPTWTEILEWPEETYDRDNAVLAIHRSPAPVVVFDSLRMPHSTLSLLTRTEADYIQMESVLSQNERLVLDPECPAVALGNTVTFVVLSATKERVSGRAGDWRRMWHLSIQVVTDA
ncbi:hypothetical protein O7599_27800 [Streptomyces sp. WMMC500]|uniref:hypothetical protein n=1 Tax=Streptomyces sp. WMMC500 TaxID=3015154 RepID=UPI00248C410B|nr:hypothetical protein [Streptomyces sp. WMMC500]WBB59350.1 hypothetical protein O7599_27800 [Streptomyces sp. WMMC500]